MPLFIDFNFGILNYGGEAVILGQILKQIIHMGKGDKKTKRGKIVKGSYGVTRPRRKKVAETDKQEKANEKE